MCFGPIRLPDSVPISSDTPSKDAQGSVYSAGDIEAYQSSQSSQIQSYSSLGAEQKATATSSEAVSIKGMVNVPVATNFSESKQSINEVAAQRGDLATVPNIDICGFLGDTSSFDFDLPNLKLGGLPSLNDIMAGINGITLPSLQIASDAIVGIVGKIGDAINDIGAAIQGSIPTISCGKPSTLPSLPSPPQMGDALKAPTVPVVSETVVEPVAYGTNPNITIESPDVTVQSLNDEIDSGEF
jgi:hypothetical protein